MPTLYQILHGKFSRKDHNGNDVVLKKDATFVPSPPELASDKFRLKPVGTVDWDSNEAKAALQNTNRNAYPDFGPSGVQAPVEFPQDVENITTIKDVPTALQIIGKVDTEDKLDAYLQQESDNRPRVRKVIISAIEARRVTLQDTARKAHIAANADTE